jgi:hypothetical protein
MSEADAAGSALLAATGALFVPPMPVISAREMSYAPTLLVQQPGKHLSVGWQYRDPPEGGPCFVIARYSVMSGYRVLDTFALTEQGWADAWRALLLRDNTLTAPMIAILHTRAAYSDLDSRTLGSLPALTYLGGYTTGTELGAGQPYDLRFLADGLIVLARDLPEVLYEMKYRDIQVAEIGGPGLVKSGGGFIGGGVGPIGVVEGLAIAAMLNAITTQSKIKTVIRVQASSSETFWLCTTVTPEALRIQLSHPFECHPQHSQPRICQHRYPAPARRGGAQHARHPARPRVGQPCRTPPNQIPDPDGRLGCVAVALRMYLQKRPRISKGKPIGDCPKYHNFAVLGGRIGAYDVAQAECWFSATRVGAYP